MWQVLKPDKADIAFVVIASCIMSLAYGSIVGGLIIVACFIYVHCAAAGFKFTIRMVQAKGDWFTSVSTKKHWLTKTLYRLWKVVLLVSMVAFCTIVWPYSLAVLRTNPNVIYSKAGKR